MTLEVPGGQSVTAPSIPGGANGALGRQMHRRFDRDRLIAPDRAWGAEVEVSRESADGRLDEVIRRRRPAVGTTVRSHIRRVCLVAARRVDAEVGWASFVYASQWNDRYNVKRSLSADVIRCVQGEYTVDEAERASTPCSGPTAAP